MYGPRLLRLDLLQVVQRLPKAVEQAPEGSLTHGYGDGLPRILDVDAADQALGGAQRQTPDPVVPDVLFHLEDQSLAVDLRLQRVEYGRHILGWKLDVHHRADHLGYVACRHASFPSLPSLRRYASTAAAPPTMSSSSLVIVSWRALFITSVRSSAISLALSVALRMATIRADCSLATLSSTAW